MGNLRLQSVLVFAVAIVKLQAKEVNLVIGLAGSGKTTIVKNLCQKADNTNIPSPGMTAGTIEAEEIQCGNQILVDTVGLMHLTDDIKTEDALYEGLNELLSYVNGHSIGRVYIVTNSNHNRDGASRVLEQVDFLKSVMNPLIAWTGVVNCWHGVCPSTLPEDERPQFLSLLNDKVDTMIEVDSPHAKPVTTALFPPPQSFFPVSLPTNWQELIKRYKVSGLKDQMKDKAKEQCNQYRDSIKAAKTDQFTCSIAECQQADCTSFPACGPPECPNFPCVDEGSCKRHRREAYPCHFMNTGTCHRDHYWDDQDCLKSVRECHKRRDESCLSHNSVRNDCLEQRENNCNALKQTAATCNNSRSTHCEQLRAKHAKANEDVVKKQMPLYDRCVNVLGYEKL